jgi:hypothetical protein
MPNNNTVRIKVQLETDSFKQASQDIQNRFGVMTSVIEQKLRRINELRRQMDSTITRSDAKLEQQELRHQQRLEAIAQRSAAQLTAIEQRKQNQLEVMRERAAQREAERLRKLQLQEQRSRSSGIGFGTALGVAGGLVGGIAAYGIGSNAIRQGFELDATRTTLQAVLGDVRKAEEAMSRLRKLTKESVGLTTQAVIESFSVFKLAGNIADQNIEKVIKSIGRLNAAFKIDDVRLFSRNLLQIFNNFDKADITQALDRIPIFNQLLQSAFGTSDPEKLRKLKAAGKITLESYLSGLSSAIDNNQALKNIKDNLESRFQKALDPVKQKLAELGTKVLEVFLPILEKVSPYILSTGQKMMLNCGHS